MFHFTQKKKNILNISKEKLFQRGHTFSFSWQSKPLRL